MATANQAQRWGIAGTGTIASAMAEALATVDGAVLAAVGSRTPAAAQAFADGHGIARAHGSYDALMADDEVDVIYVATPTGQHAAHATAALRAGKHVLCEKALTTNAAEARDLADEARHAQRFLMEAMWTWFIPATMQVQQWIAEGRIGEVRVIQAAFGRNVGTSYPRLLDPALGGGSLLDMGIYPVALSRLILGAPVMVQAVGRLGPTGVDSNVAAVLGHADGAVTTFATSLEADLAMDATIFGTAGTINLAPPFWASPQVTLTVGEQSEVVDLPHRGLAHEAEHVMACLAAGRTESDVLPLDTSVAMMETLDRIRASALP